MIWDISNPIVLDTYHVAELPLEQKHWGREQKFPIISKKTLGARIKITYHSVAIFILNITCVQFSSQLMMMILHAWTWLPKDLNACKTYLVQIPANSRFTLKPLQWRHYGGDGFSNHRCLDCLRNRLFRCRSKKTSKLGVTGLCEGNLPVDPPPPPPPPPPTKSQ